jgi:hypothetical protein
VRAKGTQWAVAVALGVVLLAVYGFLLFFLSAACADGFYTRTRSALCDVNDPGWEAVALAVVLVPAASLLAVASLSEKRGHLVAAFAAWVAVAATSGTLIVLIRNGDL